MCQYIDVCADVGPPDRYMVVALQQEPRSYDVAKSTRSLGFHDLDFPPWNKNLQKCVGVLVLLRLLDTAQCSSPLRIQSRRSFGVDQSWFLDRSLPRY
jgi:hypothetical protein